MKITGLSVYLTGLPLREGRYSWSNENSVEVFDATVVAIATDAGITGWGECTPLGSAYLPAYARGVRTGIEEIGPKLIGSDPRDVEVLNRHMDAVLRGHPYVKAPIDVACWDILGQVSGQPIWRLLGGKAQDKLKLYRAISQEAPEVMARKIAGYRREGYTKFQLKVGGDVDQDIRRIRQCRDALDKGDTLIADANTGWTMHEAARVANAVRDLDVYIEQPCPTYEECLSVRARTPLPFVLDESIDGMASLLRGIADRAFDAVNLKISKVGGLTRARQMRDLCVAAGIAMIIEDTWGGDFVTATIAHLAQSTPAELLLATTDFNSYGTRDIAEFAPKRTSGTISASDAPGLGCRPILSALGKPAITIGS